ncbi:hypothetical protein BDV95DRAFT_606653 [Massariosphaeria phaeospora]|uniref:Uncharacterized protein n=1 Tax=Massariosphaeria phaeospora TaxID=100035 RepID=A0A7C8IEF1_9PLEO|nr:hypothetical protein BDV95DRAFT_606653 [Massariosphaeria phaeospora]
MAGTHSGSGLGGAVRKGVGLVHGTGEAIRGNVNAAIDSAAGDKESAAKNQAIAARGIDEAQHGHRDGAGAGVTPVDTERERHSHVAQGEYNAPVGATGSTNHGPHSTNTANKLDPRFDSDLDGRGTQHGSTNYGPHGTNVGNKLDPRFDSDLDNRGTQHGSTNYGPHDTNIGNKLDRRFDSDLDNRGPKESQFAAGLSDLRHAQTDGSGTTHDDGHSTSKPEPRVDSGEEHRGFEQDIDPADTFVLAAHELMMASTWKHAAGVPHDHHEIPQRHPTTKSSTLDDPGSGSEPKTDLVDPQTSPTELRLKRAESVPQYGYSQPEDSDVDESTNKSGRRASVQRMCFTMVTPSLYLLKDANGVVALDAGAIMNMVEPRVDRKATRKRTMRASDKF